MQYYLILLVQHYYEWLMQTDPKCREWFDDY